MRLAVSVAMVMVLLVPTSAFAYIDPGAGSFILQALLAAAAAVFVTMRLYFRRITGFVGRIVPGARKRGIEAEPAEKSGPTPSESDRAR